LCINNTGGKAFSTGADIQAILDGQIDDDERTSNLFNHAHDADDGVEGFRAYAEKRKPDFKWNG
jgi:enoyl-CoA hydratase/carnithine racemase